MSTADAITETLSSPAELDREGEPANLVDGLFFIGRAILALTVAVENAGQNSRLS